MKLQFEAKWEDRERAKAGAISFWLGPRVWVRPRGVTAWVVLWMDGEKASQTTHG